MEKGQVYKCNSCKAIISVLQKGKGELTCCENKMANVTPSEAKRLTKQYMMETPGTP
jgi:desulfoferrodoxin-like iron-binding protein